MKTDICSRISNLFFLVTKQHTEKYSLLTSVHRMQNSNEGMACMSLLILAPGTFLTKSNLSAAATKCLLANNLVELPHFKVIFVTLV